MSNFATTNRATMLALRICSARLDPRCTHEQFAQLVADFREAIETGAAAAVPNAAQAPTAALQKADSETPAAPSADIPPASDQSPGAALSRLSAAAAAPTAETSRAPGELDTTELKRDAAGDASSSEPSTPKRSGRAASLSAEVSEQICRDYQAARAANDGSTPRGWVPTKAAELGVSVQTIYRTLERGLPKQSDAAARAFVTRRVEGAQY